MSAVLHSPEQSAPAPAHAQAASSFRAPSRSGWRRFTEHRAATVSATLLALLVIAAFTSDLFLSRSYADQSLGVANRSPLSGSGVLGTDQLGRDLLVRVLFGIRLSVAAALAAQVVQLAVGVPIGLISGYAGGKVDAVLMRLIDVILALPGMLIALIVGLNAKEQVRSGTGWPADILRTLDSASGGMAPVLLVLALFFWVSTARIVRGEVRRIMELDYVRAARAVGASPARIIRVHILRNAWGTIIVSMTFAVPLAIVTEAALSLVGVGVDPPRPSLGLMIFEGSQQVNSFPHQVLVPAAIFALITVAFMFVGDGLRDAFDPTTRTR